MKIASLLLLLLPAILAGRNVSVAEFGADATGRTDATASLQRAIDAAAAGGGVVEFPAGSYLSGSLTVRSHVTLKFAAGAMLLGSTSRADYRKLRFYALLLADQAEEIALEGPGGIDGQGAALAADVVRRWKQGELPTAKEDQRPMLIDFHACHGVTVHGLTLKNSSCWVEEYDGCDGVRLRDVSVSSLSYHNNDGVDIDSCRHVDIQDCQFDCTDDGICLKSSAGGACEEVTVRNCRIRSGANAFKLGTPSFVGFRNISASGLRITDTHLAAIAIEAVDGGSVDNVRVSDVRATHTGNGIFIRLGHRRNTPGTIRNVEIEDVTADLVPHADWDHPFGRHPDPHCDLIPSSITGIPGHPIEGVVLRRIAITEAGGGSARPVQVPEQEDHYPDPIMFAQLPSWGLYVRHASGVHLEDVTFRLRAPDARPAIWAEDATLTQSRVTTD